MSSTRAAGGSPPPLATPRVGGGDDGGSGGGDAGKANVDLAKIANASSGREENVIVNAVNGK